MTGSAFGSNESGAWLTYAGGPLRDGVAFGFNSTFHGAAFSWRSHPLDGLVYAEPLVYAGFVYAATENDSVYSINDSTGSLEWRTNLGQPVPLSALPCGDIDPLGITGTPVIDNGIIFVAAFVQPGRHILFAINASSGVVLWSRSIDPPGMNANYQQQRGALVAGDGYIYIPFGGLEGDCGTYEGWVIGVPENDSGAMFSYKVPTSTGGGIWAPSGVAFDNATNELFVTTGNSAGTTNFDFGESVIALSPTLNEMDYFAPANWASLNQGDTDLGSVGPVILSNDTIFQIGKQGVGYLLDLNHLGGIGGELYSSNVCGNEGAYGGSAYSAPYLVVPCRSEIVVLLTNLSSENLTKAWGATESFAGSPIIADGTVWNIDVDSGTLYAHNLSNGSVVFQYAVGYTPHFETPSAADGKIFVAANRTIIAFTLH